MRKRRSVYISRIGHSNELFKLQSRRFNKWIYPYTLEKKKSLWLFSNKSVIRHFFAKVINHKLFDPFILFIITLSTVALALDNPLNDPNGQLTVSL